MKSRVYLASVQIQKRPIRSTSPLYPKMLEYILIASVIAFCVAIVIQNSTKSKNEPPGPKGYPLLGVIFEMDIYNLHKQLYDWAQKFGVVFQYKILGQKFICIDSIEILEETFLKEPNATITAGRPNTFIGRYILDDSSIFYSSPSTPWSNRRKLIYRLLHKYGVGMESLESQVLQNMLTFKQNVRQISERNVNPCSFVEEFVLSMIEFLLIGRSFGREGALQRLLREEQDLVNQNANPVTFAIYSALPFLRFLPLQSSLTYAKWKRTHQEVLDKLNSLLKEDECYRAGLYYMMKEATEENDKHGKPLFTDQNLFGSLHDIVGGAYLTTRGTLLSLICILAKLQDLQKSLQNEVDEVIGQNREPRLSDRENCPLLESVVMETLRYISHAPVFLHATTKPTKFGGYDIAKGTVIAANNWSMHHSERYWEEPFRFRPERFLDKEGRMLPADHLIRKRLAVFGIGKRNCIGEVFARSRMFLFLSSLMQITTIAKPDGKPLSELDPRTMNPGLFLQPQEYEVRFLLRSQSKND